MQTSERVRPHILLVDDEIKLVQSLTRGLVEEGYAVESATDGDDARRLLAAKQFDAVVLDWMLPGTSGVELLADVRQQGNAIPVMLLTARDTVEDRVSGRDAGADDYLVKPFAFEELLARLRALLRRGAAVPQPLRVGDLEVDPVSRRAVRAGRILDLSAREFELLEYLIRHAGQIVSREALARDVWRDPEPGLSNVVDVYINYLRKKLEFDDRPRMITTVRGQGYVLASPEGTSPESRDESPEEGPGYER